MVGKGRVSDLLPRYFGPNAFPIPELVGGSLSSRWEVELRGNIIRREAIRRKISLPVCTFLS